MTRTGHTQIVVLGAGFAGLTFCQSFQHPNARVRIVDRQNHHLFQPLLYQVATAGLSAPEIAQPIRSILRDRDDITVLLGEVDRIDLEQRRIGLANGAELDYDYLVIALGGMTSYFGHPEWARAAPGLKTLDDAVRIRRDILLAFERAEMTDDPAEKAKLMTIVVVGGGPTGVELAGAFAELTRFVLRNDFRRIDPRKARVILVEAGDRILAPYPPDLSKKAEEQLAGLGVEIQLGSRVKSIQPGRVEFEGEQIEAANIIWAAGVGAHPLTRSLDVETDRAGRLKVEPDLSLPGHPEVFALGDLAMVRQPDGSLVPGIAPAAMQMARHTAKLIEAELSLGASASRPAFRYIDRGSMATIGRSAAVAQVGPIKFAGLPAWITWLVVHLLFLIGFRNKLKVLLDWTSSYFSYRRGARIITGLRSDEEQT